MKDWNSFIKLRNTGFWHNYAPVHTGCKIRYIVSICHLYYCPPLNVLFYGLKYSEKQQPTPHSLVYFYP
jgi:hypothetical protein